MSRGHTSFSVPRKSSDSCQVDGGERSHSKPLSASTVVRWKQPNWDPQCQCRSFPCKACGGRLPAPPKRCRLNQRPLTIFVFGAARLCRACCPKEPRRPDLKPHRGKLGTLSRLQGATVEALLKLAILISSRCSSRSVVSVAVVRCVWI